MDGTQTTKRKRSSRNNKFRWENNEERRFLFALELFGGDYCLHRTKIANFVGSRNEDQIRSFGQKLFNQVSILFKIWMRTATEKEAYQVESSRRRLLPDVLEGKSFEDALRAEQIRFELQKARNPLPNSNEHSKTIAHATETCDKLLLAYHQRKDAELCDEDLLYFRFLQFLAQTPQVDRATMDFLSSCEPHTKRRLLLSEIGQTVLANASPRMMAGAEMNASNPKKRKKTTLYEEKVQQQPRKKGKQQQQEPKGKKEEEAKEDNSTFTRALLPRDDVLDPHLEAKWQQFRQTVIFETSMNDKPPSYSAPDMPEEAFLFVPQALSTTKDLFMSLAM